MISAEIRIMVIPISFSIKDRYAQVDVLSLQNNDVVNNFSQLLCFT